MNTQRDISVGASTSSSAGFEEIHPRSAKVELKSKIKNQKSKIGFTLVELLVVISIIALLVGMLLPTLNRFYLAAAKAKTRAAINLIDGACQYYFNDFKDYPPSNDNTTYGGWTGSELLVLFLTGYAGDPTSNGAPDGNLDVDDGVEGFGFRLARRGNVYGPYNGAEKLSVHKGGNDRPEFVDTFDKPGKPILYYRWDSGDSEYKSGHNTGDVLTNLTQYAQNADAAYYRTDFILISRGPNEQWNAPKDGDSDDVTNFSNK